MIVDVGFWVIVRQIGFNLVIEILVGDRLTRGAEASSDIGSFNLVIEILVGDR